MFGESVLHIKIIAYNLYFSFTGQDETGQISTLLLPVCPVSVGYAIGRVSQENKCNVSDETISSHLYVRETVLSYLEL